MKTEIQVDFKLSDLKTGMVIETRSGERAVVIKDNVYGEDAIIFHPGSWVGFGGFKEDLTWNFENLSESLRTEHSKSVDIMKVFIPALPTSMIDHQNDYQHHSFPETLIYERDRLPKVKIKTFTLNIGVISVVKVVISRLQSRKRKFTKRDLFHGMRVQYGADEGVVSLEGKKRNHHINFNDKGSIPLKLFNKNLKFFGHYLKDIH